MELPPKRRAATRNAVRKAWKENLQWVDEYGFCGYILEAVEDDYQDLRICWCCGVTGYQEVAPIIPHSLGGHALTDQQFPIVRRVTQCWSEPAREGELTSDIDVDWHALFASRLLPQGIGPYKSPESDH